MAADLEADLEEAEADGVSAEEVLGSGAFDPHAFAAAWAAERGVVQPPPNGQTHRRQSRNAPAVAAIVSFALIAILGGALAVFAGPSGSERRLAVSPVFPSRVGVVKPPGAVRPRFRVVPPPSQGSGAWVFPVAAGGSRVDLRPIGLILMIVGLVGLVVSLLYSSPRRGNWSRPRAPVNHGPT
jgi:hypothetical protein